MPGNPAQFNQTPLPAALPVDIGFNAPSQLIINAPGVYEITYYALSQIANTSLAVFIDGIEAPLTRYTSTDSAGHVYGQTLINVVLVPAVVTLVNVDPMQNAAIENGSLPNTVSLSLLISKLT